MTAEVPSVQGLVTNWPTGGDSTEGQGTGAAKGPPLEGRRESAVEGDGAPACCRGLCYDRAPPDPTAALKDTS